MCTFLRRGSATYIVCSKRCTTPKKWLRATFRLLVYSGMGTLPLTQMGVITGATKKSWMCIKCGCLGHGTQLGRWRAPSTQSCQGLLARADETLDCTDFWKLQSNPVLPGIGTAVQQLAELYLPKCSARAFVRHYLGRGSTVPCPCLCFRYSQIESVWLVITLQHHRSMK